MKKLIRILAVGAVFLAGGTVLAAPHKLRVNDRNLAQSLLSRGGKLIGDYGAFTVLEADDSLLAGGDTNRVEVADDLNLIRLNAQLVDTRAPQTKALRKLRGAFSGKRLHLVHFAGPIKPQWITPLEQSGAKIISYIPENTYLIYGNTSALARMQAWAGTAEYVQWEGEYGGNLKVHPEARAAAANTDEDNTSTFAIQLVADVDSNPSTLALIDQLKLEPIQMDFEMAPYRNLIVSLPADRLDTIAAQPDVVSIQPYAQPKKRDERQDQIVAGNLSGSVPSGPGYLAWLASKGFTQAQFDDSGFVVDVADSGVDNGTGTPGHFGLYRLGDTAQSSRLAYSRVEGTLHTGGTLAGCDGHGALNGHIIGNYDDFTGTQHKDTAGYSYGVGVCPFVKLGSSVIFDNSGGASDYTRPDFSTLASDAYNSGARVANNSWGSSVGGRYDISSQIYDKLVRDAQSDIGGNQEIVMVFAAGNDGPCTAVKGKKTKLGINSPGSAKNVITVGASESVRSLSPVNGGNDPSGRDACGETDANADSANDMACASSRGPCTDGRMKPDLVAPGSHVTGGVAQDSPPPSASGVGSAISCFDSLGVCALPGSGAVGNANNFFPLGQQFYTVSSGTSHSTPVVSGAAALVRQFFINSSFTAPSPAMTKAFLINSARYMNGNGANDNLWSPSQGMGEVNLGFAFDGVSRFLRDQLPDDKFTGTGQARVFAGQVVDTGKPSRVTLAWTDAPGNTSGAAYNNNLDLTVTVGGNTYKGNVFSGQYSTTGGKADVKNNVESVFLPAGVSGDITVTVTAANINSDGVPGEAPSLDQDFALVIYNATATNVPTVTLSAATYGGLFYDPNDIELGQSGAITLTTTAAGAYSSRLQVGPNTYAFSGMFTPTGIATNVVPRSGAASLGIGLQVDVDDSDIITGTVSEAGSWTATLRMNRAISKTSPVPFAGKYTLVFPGTNGDAQLPSGDGYGTVSVSTAGKIKLTGSLADGTKISQSALALVDGEWPLYVSLYNGQGQVLGWLVFTNLVQEDLGGDVNWIKAAMPAAAFYPNGFNFETHATGSLLNPLANPLLGFTDGLVVLSGGNLLENITNHVTVNGASVVNLSTNKLSLKLTASKGTFKGSIVDPSSGATIPLNGVLLQKQGFGAGYFLGTDQSGEVLLGPAN